MPALRGVETRADAGRGGRTPDGEGSAGGVLAGEADGTGRGLDGAAGFRPSIDGDCGGFAGREEAAWQGAGVSDSRAPGNDAMGPTGTCGAGARSCGFAALGVSCASVSPADADAIGGERVSEYFRGAASGASTARAGVASVGGAQGSGGAVPRARICASSGCQASGRRTSVTGAATVDGGRLAALAAALRAGDRHAVRRALEVMDGAGSRD
jgi:hypothetical protein